MRKFAGESMPFLLIGNKIHLHDVTNSTINQEEIREFVRNEGAIYIETRQNSIDIIEEALRELIHQIIDSRT